MPPLYDQLAEIEMLRRAWHRVRASGLRSKSDATVKAVDAFAANVESRLDRISVELSEGGFDFGKARAAPIKREGKSPRPLVVPEIPARIVQRALLDVLQGQPGISEYAAHPCSFGGIARTGADADRDPRVAAFKRTYQEIESGATFFVRSDIRGFFTDILRSEVLSRISELLPDDSLDGILDRATNLELENADQIRKHLHLFPDGEVGVAQGCCLSPLFGNIYLRDFDMQMNSDASIATLRYVDDFVILGRSQRQTHKAFKHAARILRERNLDAYPLHVGGGKAEAGEVNKKGLDFLGCHLTPYRIEPSKDARRKFLNKVKEELDTSARILRSGVNSPREEHRFSFVGVLSRVSRMVRGWTEQYGFCNETDAFRSVDIRIDAMLNRYTKTFFKHYDKRRSGAAAKRRILGVWLAADCEREPLLPLRPASQTEGTEVA